MNKGMFLPNANGPAHPCHRSRTSPSAPVPGIAHSPYFGSDHDMACPNPIIPKTPAASLQRCRDNANIQSLSILMKSRPGTCNPAAASHPSPRASLVGSRHSNRTPGLRRRRRRRLGASAHFPFPDAMPCDPTGNYRPTGLGSAAQREGRAAGRSLPRPPAERFQLGSVWLVGFSVPCWSGTQKSLRLKPTGRGGCCAGNEDASPPGGYESPGDDRLPPGV